MYNWDMCLSNNDTGYLCKKYREMNLKRLNTLFTTLMDEFIQDIGLSEKTLEYYDKLAERAAYQKLYIQGKRHNASFADMITMDIETLLKNQVKEDLATSAAHASKHQGHRVNPKEYSVKEFYAIFKTIDNAAKN